MSTAPVTDAASVAAPRPRSGPADRGPVRRVLLGSPTATVAAVALVALVLVCFAGPLVWTQDPAAVDVSQALSAPSASHPMGTDNNGRDILARFMEGGRISLLVAPLVALAGLLVGGTLGVLAGVAGGVVDGVVGRVMDAILAFPALILAMAVTVGLGAGVTTAAVGIALTAVPWYAVVLRADTLRVRGRPYVEAATALGAARARVIRRHVVPHLVPTALVQTAAVFGFTILTLAGLSFVGLGAQPPTAEWGSMITDGLQSALTGQWWIGVFPGLGVFVAVCAANALADQLAIVLDPRNEER